MIVAWLSSRSSLGMSSSVGEVHSGDEGAAGAGLEGAAAAMVTVTVTVTVNVNSNFFVGVCWGGA